MTASVSKSPDPREVPAGRLARGRVAPPPSKSVTHRYLNLALLAGRRAVAAGGDAAPIAIERPLYAEDTRLFLAALPSLGFDGIAGVTVGKSFRYTIEADSEASARAEVDDVVARFLTNPVIEDSDVRIEELVAR